LKEKGLEARVNSIKNS